MTNLCFILSSIGGPKLFSQLFSKSIREDVVYLVFQHMPSDEFMDVLINCLQEDIPYPIVYLKGSVKPNPGTIYFLSS